MAGSDTAAIWGGLLCGVRNAAERRRTEAALHKGAGLGSELRSYLLNGDLGWVLNSVCVTTDAFLVGAPPEGGGNMTNGSK